MKMRKTVVNKYARIVNKVVYIVLYYLFSHRKHVVRLSKYGLTNIKTHQIRRWLRVVRGEKLVRFYYHAKLNNKPCFVKMAKQDSTLKNEIFINKYLTQCGATFAPRLLISDENYDKDTTMMVFETIVDVREFELPDNEATLESICECFEDIYKFFLEHGIVHGDINESNLLLSQDNQIILLDFGLASSLESDISSLRDSVQHGYYYQFSANARIYDDAYSFLKMLDDSGVPEAFKKKECYQRIEKLVGVHSRSIIPNR